MIWYLLGGIAALLALLLAPVTVDAFYRDGQITATARYLVLRRQLYPAPEQKPRRKKEKKPPAQPEKPEPEPEKGSFFTLVQTLNDTLPAIAAGAGYIVRRITMRRCRVRMTVARGDAAETAIACGRANAALYTAYALLANTIKVKEFDAQVAPDYDAEKSSANAFVRLRMRPATAFGGGLQFLRRGGSALLRTTKKDR